MLYNPQNVPEPEFLRSFVARQPLLQQLLDDLRRAGPAGASQHHLLLGQRGLGKTTLLRRLALAVRDDQELSAVWLALSFPEEQYNVAKLADFWLNCADALSEAFDQAGRTAEAAALDGAMERLGPRPETAEALRLLRSEAERLGRRFVLLVDNLDIVLDRIEETEEWELRRTLSEEKSLTVIGASSRVLEAFYDHGRAFYDFFQVHELKGLDDEEAFAVLRQLAEALDAAPVKRVLEEDPARVRALRLLTGGNPRTIALLFRVFQREETADHADGKTMKDLEELLDLYTPLYKARFEDLPELSQRVVDAMAIHWDPMTAGDLAERMALEVNVVSAQLNRLVSAGVVEKVPWFGEKKTGFQIAERFFNIWYLMRASRRVRRGLVWYVKFLATFLRAEDLRARAEKLVCDADAARRNPEQFAQLTMAYAQEAGLEERLRGRLEHAGLRTALAAPDRVRELIDFRDLPENLREKKARMEKMRSLAAALPQARADWGDVDPGEFWRLLAGSPSYDVAEKARIVESLAGMRLEDLRRTRDGWARQRRKIERRYRREAASVERMFEALASGEMNDPFDWETAVAIENGPALAAIALATRVNPDLGSASEEDIRRAKAAGEAMAKHPDLAARGYNHLGNLLWFHQCRYGEAESAYRRAIELDPDLAYPWNGLGYLLHSQLLRYEEAEAAYQRAIELDPEYASPWNNLGNLLQDHLRRYEEAEAAHRRAIELDPESARPWNGLGNLLQDHLRRYQEAEAAYRRAIELDPESAYPWNGLGTLLQYHLRRYEEAEAAYRRAIQLDPHFVYPWSNLGRLYAAQHRWEDACHALLEAVRRDATRTWDQSELLACVRRLGATATALSLADKAARALPDSTEARLLPAEVHLGLKQWPAATEIIRRVASDPNAGPDSFDDLAGAAVINRFTAELRQLLEETGAHERWRPLHEALRAVEAGSADYLRRVSPEVRYVAERIYRRLRGDRPGEP